MSDQIAPTPTTEDPGGEIERLCADLEALRREQATLWRAVIHELRTPVQVITGFVSLVEPGLPYEKQAYYYGFISRETARLAGVAEDLEAQVDLESGVMQFEPAVIELEPLLLEAARDSEASGPDHIVDMWWQGDLPHVSADPGRAREVLDILLRNAARYSSVERPVRLEARTRDGCVALAVRDDGPDIPLEYQAVIFDRHIRLPKPEARPARWGLGFGLYVARQIARRLGGDLTVDSRPGQGSTFILTLPMVEDPPLTLRPAKGKGQGAEP